MITKIQFYIESALHFSHTRGRIGRRISNALQEVVHCVRILGVRHKNKMKTFITVEVTGFITTDY